MSNADLVAQFHRAVGDAPKLEPQIPEVATIGLRESLIREEADEAIAELQGLAHRIRAGEDLSADDLAPLAHELADLLYVTYGTFVALGLPADAVFAEVHRANLAKTTGPRRSDGKQLKPDGWQPADVPGVLRAARPPRQSGLDEGH